jgi:hypothetical protein
MAIKYTDIYHSKALQNVPKIGFWLENKPSGNTLCMETGSLVSGHQTFEMSDRKGN